MRCMAATGQNYPYSACPHEGKVIRDRYGSPVLVCGIHAKASVIRVENERLDLAELTEKQLESAAAIYARASESALDQCARYAEDATKESAKATECRVRAKSKRGEL
jgi:hypothetical protein